MMDGSPAPKPNTDPVVDVPMRLSQIVALSGFLDLVCKAHGLQVARAAQDIADTLQAAVDQAGYGVKR